jgi:hypothetical protein
MPPVRRALRNFGSEDVTRSAHLEKLALIAPGVGRDGISDFTTCLIKEYLAEYTQTFAQEHLKPEQCKTVTLPRVRFNYATETWQSGKYLLPWVRGDYVLLTPLDMLTQDDTWISSGDLERQLPNLVTALPDDQLRAHVNLYFTNALGENPSAEEKRDAVRKTIMQYSEVIDYYIKEKEAPATSGRSWGLISRLIVRSCVRRRGFIQVSSGIPLFSTRLPLMRTT